MIIKDIINDIENFSPRNNEINLDKVANYIKEKLTGNGIDFNDQYFYVEIPIDKGSYIKLETGEKIIGKANSFYSGSFEDKNIYSSQNIYQDIKIPHINFNQYYNAYSGVIYYDFPVINIKKEDLDKVISSENIEVYVNIDKKLIKTENILVGNINNPKYILFSHFDTIFNGAVDNSSGTALLLYNILDNLINLKESLIVFSGSEELSYDKPYYWGYGYRLFEYEYKKLMHSSKKIIVVDMFGSTKPIMTKEFIKEAFPIMNTDFYDKSIQITESDINTWIKSYHSEADTIDKINNNYLEEAEKLLISIIHK
ncbi:aminopeptidase Iap family-like protein [Nanobdella aerobiophila]|uniref:Aminopeptidase Iap family-like protein n=1 Tax=Nanobdella aerobiophila TaxID=2586965 RepID=A0A915SD00_9ARCH|nr:M28 family metallopeptidase [Nanobdella aerobiophila]BBL45808.1 aminopeptidase Iap family-like protein [Nanobdella aerobiophila]